jgi:hypothetical protein
MNASEFDDPVVCEICGKYFYDKLVPDKTVPARMKKKRLISKWKQLAGHIMKSDDHPNKNWAKKFLLDANVGTGLWGDKRGWI